MADDPHRLFLLDGMALVYRAHFAFIRNPITTSAGLNTSAIFGFASTLVELLKKQGPTHLAVVFDTSASTFRHEEFPEYKANREAMPEELAAAIPNVKRLCEAMHIPVITQDGFEADDIIGTLAAQADAEGGFETFMVTPDKDFAQLVSDTTTMYKPGRGGGDPEVLGVPEILEQWGIERADQVIDILGLWGDASDNIPGVPGIGEKTAKKLIGIYGTIDGILAKTDELKGKQKENLENFGEQARLSRRLATIKTDVPLELAPSDLALREMDEEKVADICEEFEFNAIGKRLFGADFAAGRTARAKAEAEEEAGGPPKTIEDTEHSYRLIDTDKGRAAFAKELGGQKAFCFDVETTDLDPLVARLHGIAFSWEAGEGAYYVIPEEPEASAAALDHLRPAFGAEGVEKIAHNLKFDLEVMGAAGVEVAGPFVDTMLAHSLIEPAQRHGMDYLSEVYLHYRPISIKTLIETGKKDADDLQGELLLDGDAGPKTIDDAPLEEVAEYAAEDADVTWQLAEKLLPLVDKAGLQRVFVDVECPLVPVLAKMEMEGVRIDCGALAAFGETLGEHIESYRADVFKLADGEFNLNSPKQLGEVLFDKLKLSDKPKKTTKTGQYVTNESVLSQLAAEGHDIAAKILEYREAAKLKSTYVDALPNAVHPKTGRVHTNFNQLVTDTGRLASSGPNLQNIPVRTAQGREVRRAFVPRDEEHLLLAADYSQIELRIMAAVSGDPGMLAAFAAGEDIHTATAAKVFGVSDEEVSKEQRGKAKMVNFGIIYGISAFGLSQRLRIPRKEAKDIIDGDFASYPGVKDYMDNTIAEAKENGYVETLTGRRRYLRDIDSRNGTVRGRAEREAINTPIQGSAADMIKIAMARVEKALREGGFASKMVLQVHDELVLDCPEEELDPVTPLVVEHMGDALPLPGVPVVVETGTGLNWLEAH